jgi:hypothetical protein
MGYGPEEALAFLNKQKDLGGDVQSLKNGVVQVWNDPTQSFDVGESATIYRFVWFYLQKFGIRREIITKGTLTARVAKMRLDPEIINWPLTELQKLEGGTSQWATMAILMGNTEALPEVSFYLQKTFNSLRQWREQRLAGKFWTVQADPTLLVQSEEYISFLKTRKIKTVPTRLGDCDLYCFLRAFGVMSAEEGKKLWPQVQFHESDRIKEMERTLKEFFSGNIINTDDHRPVQAIAKLIRSLNLNLSVSEIRERFSNPDCTGKSWDKFWEFLGDVPAILEII